MQSDQPHDMQRLTILDSYHNSMLPVYHPDPSSKTNYNKHVVPVHAIIIIMLLYLITETWIVETCLNLGTELAMQLTTESEKASSIG